jgi:hypothetical protein
VVLWRQGRPARRVSVRVTTGRRRKSTAAVKTCPQDSPVTEPFSNSGSELPRRPRDRLTGSVNEAVKFGSYLEPPGSADSPGTVSTALASSTSIGPVSPGGSRTVASLRMRGLMACSAWIRGSPERRPHHDLHFDGVVGVAQRAQAVGWEASVV